MLAAALSSWIVRCARSWLSASIIAPTGFLIVFGGAFGAIFKTTDGGNTWQLVKFVSDNIALTTWRALSTRAGGEVAALD